MTSSFHNPEDASRRRGGLAWTAGGLALAAALLACAGAAISTASTRRAVLLSAGAAGTAGAAISVITARDAGRRGRGAATAGDAGPRTGMVREVAEVMPACFWLADGEGRRTYFSKLWLETAGRTLEQERGDGWIDNVHPEDRERCRAVVRAAVASKGAFSAEYRLASADGTYRSVLDRGAPRIGVDGRMEGFVGCCVDLTPLRQAEAEARRNNEFFQALTALAPTGIYRTDTAGMCCFVSDWWVRLTGLPTSDALGAGWARALHPEDKDRVFREWGDAVAQKREFLSQYRFKTPQGEVRHVLGRATPLVDEGGVVTGFIGVVTDITESMQANLRLEQGLARERVLRRELSHRVRNNLAGLHGLISVYERSGCSGQELAQAMRSNITALAEVHGLIGKADLSGVDMGELLGQLRDKLVKATDRSRLTLSGPPIRLPPTRAGAMGMIVQEMITNSIKHGVLAGSKGRIRIQWSRPAASQMRFEWREEREGAEPAPETLSSNVGLSLIKGFAETDLGGSYKLEATPASWTITITAELAPSMADFPAPRPAATIHTSPKAAATPT